MGSWLSQRLSVALVPLAALGWIVSCGSDSDEGDDDGFLSCTTQIDSALPDWIKDSFKCVTVTTETIGGNLHYVFTTDSVPNYNSYYFGSDDSRYEAMPSGNNANPNRISEQGYTLKIRAAPTVVMDGDLTTAGGDMQGVTVNGIAIYDNDAAPGDTLADELVTMDSGNGHPTNVGAYHHHTEPYKLTNNDGKLVGVMKDGFPVYGRKEEDGSAPVYAGCTVAQANAKSVDNCQPHPVKMPNFHCHTTSHFPSGVCHYHVVTADPYIVDYLGNNTGVMTHD